jgi:catechol 2,3-dioxygenase-like lactoylglutathione lyase family enzyme
MRWSFLAPNLPVRDVPAAHEWYRDVLGLAVNWIWEDNFGSVGQDSVELFLYETDELEPKPWG